MTRWILIAWLGFIPIFTNLNGSAVGDDLVRLAPPDLTLVVDLRITGEEEVSKFEGMIEKIQKRGATHVTFQITNASEGLSATLVAKPQAHPQRIGRVVQELLEFGITKLSVDVKK